MLLRNGCDCPGSHMHLSTHLLPLLSPTLPFRGVAWQGGRDPCSGATNDVCRLPFDVCNASYAVTCAPQSLCCGPGTGPCVVMALRY